MLYASQEEFDRWEARSTPRSASRVGDLRNHLVVRKDAAPIDVLLSLTPIDHPDWGGGGGHRSGLDITDRKRAERE